VKRSGSIQRAAGVVVSLVLLGFGVSVALAAPADAHVPTFTLTCDQLSVNLTKYKLDHGAAHNHVSVVVGGTVVKSADFGTTFARDFPIAAHTAPVSVRVDVTAFDDPDGSHHWSRIYTGDSAPCTQPGAGIPHVSATTTCTSIVLTLENTGGSPLTFTLTKKEWQTSFVAYKSVTVGAGAQETVTVPATTGTAVRVTAPGLDAYQIFAWTAPASCVAPSASAVPACAGLTVTLANGGSVPFTFTVDRELNGGWATIKTMTVVGGGSRHFTVNADQTLNLRVTGANGFAQTFSWTKAAECTPQTPGPLASFSDTCEATTVTLVNSGTGPAVFTVWQKIPGSAVFTQVGGPVTVPAGGSPHDVRVPAPLDRTVFEARAGTKTFSHVRNVTETCGVGGVAVGVGVKDDCAGVVVTVVNHSGAPVTARVERVGPSAILVTAAPGTTTAKTIAMVNGQRFTLRYEGNAQALTYVRPHTCETPGVLGVSITRDAATLPVTGSGTGLLAEFAALLMLGGLGLVVAGRRPVRGRHRLRT
jgi:hypothetical protein